MHSDNEDDATDFVALADGRIAFTEKGLDYYRSYFGYAGIDIHRIKTREDLDQARRRAFPYFFAFAAEHLGKQEQTLEIRSLLAVVQGDWLGFERANRLSLITSPRDEPTAPS
jgi:hypothetical protein